jgi:hypothetical protein
MRAIDCKCELTLSSAKPLMDKLQDIEDCNGVQVHPTRSPCQLGIPDAMLAEMTDNTSPLEFYQSAGPTLCSVCLQQEHRKQVRKTCNKARATKSEKECPTTT